MDGDDLAKAGMEIMLRPVTDIAENALGLLGGDWLSEKRARTRAKLKAKTEEILRERKIALDTDPSPSVVIPLLTAAQDEGREELLNLWAALLAAGSDPSRRGSYRREFVDIAKQLEPVDAIVLRAIGAPGKQIAANGREEFVKSNELTHDQLEVSIQKLSGLGLVSAHHLNSAGSVVPTSLARELCRMIVE